MKQDKSLSDKIEQYDTIWTSKDETLDVKHVRKAVKKLKDELSDDQGIFQMGVEDAIDKIFGEKLVK